MKRRSTNPRQLFQVDNLSVDFSGPRFEKCAFIEPTDDVEALQTVIEEIVEERFATENRDDRYDEEELGCHEDVHDHDEDHSHEGDHEHSHANSHSDDHDDDDRSDGGNNKVRRTPHQHQVRKQSLKIDRNNRESSSSSSSRGTHPEKEDTIEKKLTFVQINEPSDDNQSQSSHFSDDEDEIDKQLHGIVHDSNGRISLSHGQHSHDHEHDYEKALNLLNKVAQEAENTQLAMLFQHRLQQATTYFPRKSNCLYDDIVFNRNKIYVISCYEHKDEDHPEVFS